MQMYGPPSDCKGKVAERKEKVCANVFGLFGGD
jgi:hypothetical protein